RRRRSDDVSGRQTPSHAYEHGDANCRLQKRAAIVSRLFFTMKIPTPACGGGDDLLRAIRRNGCAGSKSSGKWPVHQTRSSMPKREAWSAMLHGRARAIKADVAARRRRDGF